MIVPGPTRSMDIGTAGQIGCFVIAVAFAVGAMALYVCIRTGFGEPVAVRFLIGAVAVIAVVAFAWRVVGDRLG